MSYEYLDMKDVLRKESENMDKKIIAATVTPVFAEELKKLSTKITVVFPATPLARKILFCFLRGNAAMRRLADAMVWGQVSAEDYSMIGQRLDDALKTVESVIKDAETRLSNIERERKARIKKAIEGK